MVRPRKFDLEEALEAAMKAFWEHGYEATSLADLMQAMSLQKGSIYKAFGDKYALFLNAVERYINAVYEFHRIALGEKSSPGQTRSEFHQDIDAAQLVALLLSVVTGLFIGLKRPMTESKSRQIWRLAIQVLE